MKGICFIEPLFLKTKEGRKVMTRRISEKPRYKVGEILYLKEPYLPPNEDRGCVYRYGMDAIKFEANFKKAKWKNKRFMPQSAARYFIQIIGIGYEKMQDISDEDCKNEGICLIKPLFSAPGFHWDRNSFYVYNTPQEAFAALIDKINGAETWESNPDVWVYHYKLVEKPSTLCNIDIPENQEIKCNEKMSNW